jgi:putative IMPACT (imprinted ancient) family translation regulator
MKRLDFSEPVSLIIDKSTFISELFDIRHKDDISIVIHQLKALNPKATHIAYGYVIDKDHYGSDDANEPKGTAGQPIVDVLKRAELSGVLCTVIRYYGGQMLGASKLTQAYRQSALNALSLASFKVLTFYHRYHIVMSYRLYQELKPKMLEKGIIEHETFFEHVAFDLLHILPPEAIKQLSYGSISLKVLEPQWV